MAEDYAVNQRLAARLLENRGHTVVVAATGKAALEAWETQPFDLILMDAQMPEMDDREATAAIRARERESRTQTRSAVAPGLPWRALPDDRGHELALVR